MTAHSSSKAVPASDERRRWIALYVLCAGMLMIVLDVTVVNVALPSIQSDLGFSGPSLAWVVNAYLISFGGLLLLAGRFGDLLGHRRMFLAGLVVFTSASLVCGLADSQEVLVGARFVQGVGGAMTSAVILGMIVTMFPEPREQARAIGVYGFVASAGGSIGLLAGGVLTQAIDWHWIFFVNVPIGIITATLALRLLEPGEGVGLNQGADVPGALLLVTSLMLVVYTIVVPAARHGWSAGETLGLGAVSLALLVGFLVREATAARPLIPLGVFRSRNLTGANVIQALLVAGMFGMFFLGALYLQRVLQYDALEIGLAFLPTTLVMGTMSLRYSERLVTRFGPRRVLIAGMSLATLGLAWFAQVPAHDAYVVHVLPALVVLGLGIGGSFPALMALAMTGAGPQDAGLASGLVNTTAQVGGALGLAVLATAASTHSHGLIGHGTSTASALTSGYQVAFWIGAGLVAVAIAVAVFVLEGGAALAAGGVPAGESERGDEIAAGVCTEVG